MDAADTILSVIDTTVLACYLVSKAPEEGPGAAAVKKRMDEQKGALIEALDAKARALLDLHPEGPVKGEGGVEEKGKGDKGEKSGMVVCVVTVTTMHALCTFCTYQHTHQYTHQHTHHQYPNHQARNLLQKMHLRLPMLNCASGWMSMMHRMHCLVHNVRHDGDDMHVLSRCVLGWFLVVMGHITVLHRVECSCGVCLSLSSCLS